MSRGRTFKDAALLEDAIGRSRLRLSRDLAALDREFALRSLFVHALRLFSGGQGAPALRDAVRQNAVPLGLIGIGLAWMTFAGPDSSALRATIRKLWQFLDATGHGNEDDASARQAEP